MSVESNLKALFRAYKRKAKKRGHRWDLSYEEFAALTAMDCYVCGTPPSQVYIHSYKQAQYVKEPLIYTGIDRTDNKKPYELSNSYPMCGMCNYAKGKKTLHEMLEHVEKIYEFAIKPHLVTKE